MHNKMRQLRRSARLLFPKTTLDPSVIDQIVEEGFCDVCVTFVEMEQMFTDQGFNLEQAEQLAQIAQKRGLTLTAFVSYMKYQHPLLAREPQRAMLVCDPLDINNRSLKTSDMLCPFQPDNKQRYLDLLGEITKLPALREIHLNDEASLSIRNCIGCYCPHCTNQFEKITGSPPPRTCNWSDSLWITWLETRMQSWIDVHVEFRDHIKNTLPSIAVGIKHGPRPAAMSFNPWKEAISLAHEAECFDVLALNPYHFTHIHIADFRPHRRIVSEVTRTLVGACLDCDTNVYPQGFMPPGVSTPLNRQDGLLAGIVPFALGADTTMPFDYVSMKTIPGYFEAFAETRRLHDHLEKRTPYTFATVLNPMQSEIRGHGNENWGRSYLAHVAEMMYRSGLSWRWFHDRHLETLPDRLAGPLIVPDAHCLTQDQIDAIHQVVARGEGVLWIGNVATEPWPGSGPAPIPSRFQAATFELDLDDNHPLVKNITRPVMLETRVDWSEFEGITVGRVNGQPGLVLNDQNNQREAWLSGLPMHTYVRPADHSQRRIPTGGVELWQRLLIWLAQRQPLVQLDPYPPPNDYGRTRPWDARDVPTMELLPLHSDNSVLAIIFPYAPVGFNTSLLITPRKGTDVKHIEEIWKGEDLDPQYLHNPLKQVRIPLRVPANCELLAILIEF